EDCRGEPWDVIWFEYGNETDHGDHFGNKITAAEYGRRYLEYRQAMKAVDPRIKLGVVLATLFPNLESCAPLAAWPCPVLEVTGANVDFVIHHSYLPGYGRNDGEPEAKELFRIALAGGDQIQEYYDDMRRLLRDKTGRDDILIAITEYNGHFVQQQPVPYRHCLGNALVIADMLRVFCNPANKIAMANFWLFANEYWGAVKGYVHKNDVLVKRPQYYVFELYAQHFGRELLAVKIDSPTYNTPGGYGVKPAGGTGQQFREFAVDILPDGPWKLSDLPGVEHKEKDGILEVEFTGQDVDYRHAQKYMQAEPIMGYHLIGQIKTELEGDGEGVCYEMSALGLDGTVIGSICSIKIGQTTDWTEVEAHIVTSQDTKRLRICPRRGVQKKPVKGKAYFRNVRIQKYLPRIFPAVSFISANASQSEDGRNYYLMIINKNLDQPIDTTISLAGLQPTHARAWMLTGPGPEATNETNSDNVKIREKVGRITKDKVTITLPPCSLTALEVDSR
ncbi:MAG: hypothetical protein JSV03_16920, partial [Planctomycetota bacterium]